MKYSSEFISRATDYAGAHLQSGKCGPSLSLIFSNKLLYQPRRVVGTGAAAMALVCAV